jgi:hypothetical protein
MVRLDVVGHIALGELNGLKHDGKLARLVADRDHVAFLDPVGRDVDALAVHRDMAVVHELPGGEDRWHELCAVDHGVEPPLEQTRSGSRRYRP